MLKQFIIYFLLTVTVMLTANTYPSENTKSRRCWSQISPQHSAGQSKTFIFSTGANTGKLQYANQDARQLKKAMQNRFNVPNKQVCLIENVYRAEFEQALIDLKPLVKPRDLVIIIFSGHGSYVKDDNGDESDNYDDVLVTVNVEDIEMPDRNEVITDDRLVKLVNALPTPRILTFLDACFSGGMNMGRGYSNQHIEVKSFKKGSLGHFKNVKNVNFASPQSFAHLKGVIFAAAREDENAWEDKDGGTFTRNFLKQLKRHPRLSLKRLFDDTAIEMRKSKRDQLPQHPKIMGDISLAETI